MRICLWTSCLTACCVWRRSGWSKWNPENRSVKRLLSSGELSLTAWAFIFQQGQGALQVLQSGRPREGGHPEGPGSPGGHRPRRGGQCQAAQVLDDGTQQNIQEPFNDCCASGGEEPQPVTKRRKTQWRRWREKGAETRKILKKGFLLSFLFLSHLETAGTLVVTQFR